jgi:hypothetical protein
VTDNRDNKRSDAAFQGDHGYDEAHEAMVSADPGATAQQQQHVQVDVSTDNDGDYGYDMAHDMRT